MTIIAGLCCYNSIADVACFSAHCMGPNLIIILLRLLKTEYPCTAKYFQPLTLYSNKYFENLFFNEQNTNFK